MGTTAAPTTTTTAAPTTTTTAAPTTTTTTAAPTTTTKFKCQANQFAKSGKCYACTTGYTCDGTEKITKAKTACKTGEVAQLQCVTCPSGHNCANGIATKDGVPPPAPPAEKKDKLSSSNALSVALPLCLTALIMFK